MNVSRKFAKTLIKITDAYFICEQEPERLNRILVRLNKYLLNHYFYTAINCLLSDGDVWLNLLETQHASSFQSPETLIIFMFMIHRVVREHQYRENITDHGKQMMCVAVCTKIAVVAYHAKRLNIRGANSIAEKAINDTLDYFESLISHICYIYPRKDLRYYRGI